MTLNYRQAEITDLDAVFTLYMDDGANQFLTFDPMSLVEFSSVYRSLMKEDTIFVAELDGEVVATYRLIQKTHRQSHILYLGGFTVKNSFTGKGLGFAILDHLKIIAKEKAVSRIELTVDTENNAAINLYRKVGFEIEGKLKNNYRLSSTGKYYDEYIMALLID
jgi:putative acetyltransferase